MKTLLLSLISLSTAPLLPQFNIFTEISKLSEISDPFMNKIEEFKDIKVKRFYVDSKQIMWICTQTGLYKTSDGVVFEKINLDSNFQNTLDIIVDALGNYYLSADNNANTGKSITVYKSTDGKNFKRVFTTQQSSSSGVLSFHSTGIFLGTYNKIYVSGNQVENWNEWHQFPPGHSITDMMISDMIEYVATAYGLYQSKNGFAEYDMVLSKPIHSIIEHDNKIYAIQNNTTYYVANKPSRSEKAKFTEVTTTGLTYNSMGKTIFDNNGTMWTLSNNVLFKSTDGRNFNAASNWNPYYGSSALIIFNNTMFTGGFYGLFNINTSPKLFLDMNTPDYQGQEYNGFVFKKEQTISIKDNYIESVRVDEKNITIPAKDIPITLGEHNVVIKLKEEFKSYALTFKNGNEFGEIKYNFLIKPGIKTNDVAYKVNQDDTELLQGLTSNAGNTVDKEIIQTRIKDGTGSHTASLNIKITDSLIDFSKSYYIAGNVDENNNFSATGTQEKITQENSITKDGIYHLFIVDFLGNSYESYLELGEENWKLQGAFNDQELDELATKLNVVIKFSDPSERQKALTWLKNYQTKADKALKDAVKSYGKEFEINLNDIGSYKSFLDPIEYHGTDTKESINYQKLNSLVTATAETKLNNELDKLPKDLNVDIKNVSTKSSLEAYKTWILNYEKYISENKDKWINKSLNTIGRGFASDQQIQQIKKIAQEIPLQEYLKHVVWSNPDNWNNLIKATTNYEELVDLEQFHKILNTWVENNLPEIEAAYKNAIQVALSGLDLHGYSVEELMAGRQMPQTKAEIENFADNMSFHDWLQTQANTKFKSSNLSLGLGIGIPIAVVMLALIVFGFWRYNTKYNPAGARKKLRIRTKKLNDDQELEIE